MQSNGNNSHGPFGQIDWGNIFNKVYYIVYFNDITSCIPVTAI
jgi:hypothetical protein